MEPLSTVELLELAHYLHLVDGWEEIPISRLLGARWTMDPNALDALRPLLRADLLRWTETPGMLVLVD